MIRRRPPELQINHERWLVSYADFITLLFGFFVVMYSISQVNESKYRVLSDTLLNTFQTAPRKISPIQVGDPALSATPSVIDNGEKEQASVTGDSQGNEQYLKTAELPQLQDLFAEQFADLISNELVEVNANEMWLEVELKSNVLFTSGEANPTAQARAIFKEVAQILKPYNNPVQVEGFTDNIPISSAKFPSNWELSTARAAAAVRLMMDDGISPDRLAAVGYGEFQPIASNDTAAGRAKNRRVVLMIAREKVERPKVANAEDMAGAIASDKGEVNPPAQPEGGLNLPASAPGDTDTPTPTLNKADFDRLAPVGGIKPVETESGGLLFTSDPDLPRQSQP